MRYIVKKDIINYNVDDVKYAIRKRNDNIYGVELQIENNECCIKVIHTLLKKTKADWHGFTIAIQENRKKRKTRYIKTKDWFRVYCEIANLIKGVNDETLSEFKNRCKKLDEAEFIFSF